MSVFRLPSDIELRQLLDMLYNGDAEVRECQTIVTLSDTNIYVGTYDADDGALAGACVCDLPLAASVSSALSMIPKGGAQQAVSDGELTTMMLANLREVMNIFSRLMMTSKTAHLRFSQIYRGSELASDTRATLEAMTARKVFEVSVPGYATGLLWILVR